MALINCPECGKQISSNAEQCINCGCKITYCPDCQTATAGVIAQCPVCGYKFAKKIVPAVREEIDGELSETAEIDLLKAWQTSMPNDKKIMTGFKYIKIILSVLPVLMILIAAILISNWKNMEDPLEKIAGVEGLKSGLQALIALACIMGIIGLLFDYSKESFVKIRCGNWLKKQKIDCVTYINETIKNRGDDYYNATDINDILLFKESAYISVNPSVKTSIIIGWVIRIICATVFMICVGVCLMQNVEEFIRVEIYEDKFNFKYIALIAAGVTLLVWFISTLITDHAYEKKYDKWRENNIITYKQNKEK